MPRVREQTLHIGLRERREISDEHRNRRDRPIREQQSQRARRPASAAYAKRANTASVPALVTTLMKAVTASGAPSYTSGAHTWNGTRLNLNAMPTRNRPLPSRNSGSASPDCDAPRAPRAARAEQQRHAVEQESRRHRREDQILERRFARGRARRHARTGSRAQAKAARDRGRSSSGFRRPPSAWPRSRSTSISAGEPAT